MEKERLASLGQLIGGIAHNLKTPIMSISGAAEGLSDLVKEYDESIGDSEVTNDDHHAIARDMTEWIEKIKSYTEYMSDVITTVKGQAVTLSENETISFDLDELVKRVNILMKHELKNALVTLNVHINTDSKTIITVGRLERQKGYDLLLQALPIVYEKHPDWHVNIFGDGSEREALKKQRAELGLGNFVTFKGYVRNIEQEYAGSAFFVLSSRFEGFPMVLLEAAACGLPIVSFDCPEGPSTLLKNGGGLLVPIGDVGKLGETINLLIENHELRDKLMRQSQELVRLYAPESIYCKWLNLFREYGKAEAYEKA